MEAVASAWRGDHGGGTAGRVQFQQQQLKLERGQLDHGRRAGQQQ